MCVRVCACVSVFLICLSPRLPNCTILILVECAKEFLFFVCREKPFLVQTVPVIISNSYKLLSDTPNGFCD